MKVCRKFTFLILLLATIQIVNFLPVVFAQIGVAIEVTKVSIDGRIPSKHSLYGDDLYTVFIWGKLTKSFNGDLILESSLSGEIQVNINGKTFIGDTTGVKVLVGNGTNAFNIIIKGSSPPALVQGEKGMLVPGEKRTSLLLAYASVEDDLLKLDLIFIDKKLEETINPIITSEEILEAKIAIEDVLLSLQNLKQALELASSTFSLANEKLITTQAEKLVRQANESLKMREFSSALVAATSAEENIQSAVSGIIKVAETEVYNLISEGDSLINQKKGKGYDISQALELLTQAKNKYQISASEEDLRKRIQLLKDANRDAAGAIDLIQMSPRLTSVYIYWFIGFLIVVIIFVGILYWRAKRKAEEEEPKLPSFEDLIKRGRIS